MRSRHLTGAAAALALGLFLLGGGLSGEEFVRGIYGGVIPTKWDSLELLHPNRVWNYDDYGHPSAQSYIDSAYAHGMKPFLRLWEWNYPDPFWMEKYSCGLYQKYEAEQSYNSSPEALAGLGYYYFFHGDSFYHVRGDTFILQNPAVNGWKCNVNNHDAGTILKGPTETAWIPTNGDTARTEIWMPGIQSDWPDSPRGPRLYRTTLRAATDTGPTGYDAFRLWVGYDSLGNYNNDVYRIIFDTTLQRADFGGTYLPNFKEFVFEYEVPDYTVGGRPLNSTTFHVIEWPDQCNLWVDWVETMDLERAKYLFERDAAGDFIYRDSTCNTLVAQCQAWENAGTNAQKIAGWKQSDEPIRASFPAHGVVHDRLGANHPPAAAVPCVYYQGRSD
ncbi:MAG: hypothetical protein C4524_11765 [Candidatus Zixiibacteriota bacterium]|nr:MAG: hypothetical protein C4524_11765 [candidate division Zixibacteria bacterium]